METCRSEKTLYTQGNTSFGFLKFLPSNWGPLQYRHNKTKTWEPPNIHSPCVSKVVAISNVCVPRNKNQICKKRIITIEKNLSLNQFTRFDKIGLESRKGKLSCIVEKFSHWQPSLKIEVFFKIGYLFSNIIAYNKGKNNK